MPKLSPLISEFKTLEEADAYDRWFRAKVTAALADRRAVVAHDRVMADIARIVHEGVKP
jgi:hypothetical protein